MSYCSHRIHSREAERAGVALLVSLSPSPVCGWCCPYLGRVFPHQLSLSGNDPQTHGEVCLLGGSNPAEVLKKAIHS